MESVALYSFQATESDELAFNKGDTLKRSLWVISCRCPACLQSKSSLEEWAAKPVLQISTLVLVENSVAHRLTLDK